MEMNPSFSDHPAFALNSWDRARLSPNPELNPSLPPGVRDKALERFRRFQGEQWQEAGNRVEPGQEPRHQDRQRGAPSGISWAVPNSPLTSELSCKYLLLANGLCGYSHRGENNEKLIPISSYKKDKSLRKVVNVATRVNFFYTNRRNPFSIFAF